MRSKRILLAIQISLCVWIASADLGQAATIEDVVKSIRSLPALQRKTMLEEAARKEGK